MTARRCISVKLAIMFLLAFISNEGVSQTFSISGNVLSADSQMVHAASVRILEKALGTSTNSQGAFSLMNITKGTYTLEVSCLGYLPKFENVVLDRDLNLNIFLKESVSLLPLVSVIIGAKDLVHRQTGSAHFISSKELERFNYTDANKLLRSVPGLNIQEEDGFGLRPNIGMRGTGTERSSRINLMEDGVPIAPAPYTAPAAYYFPTIGRMHAIEILKGSSQIKYGPFTTGGALNLISTPIPMNFGSHFEFGAGNFGQEQLHAYVGKQYQQVGFLFETFRQGSEGFKELDNNGDTGFRKNDYLLKFRVNTSEDAKFKQSLLLKLSISQEKSHESYLGLSLDDFKIKPYHRYAASQNDLFEGEQRHISLSHEIQISSQLKIVTSAYRNSFARNWYKLNKVIDSSGKKHSIASVLHQPDSALQAFAMLKGDSSFTPAALELKANNRDYLSQGLQSTLIADWNRGRTKHFLEIGLRLHQDEMDRFQWEDSYSMQNGNMLLIHAGIPGTESNRIESSKAIAAFAQYSLSINKFKIVPGLRLEDIRMTRLDYGKSDPSRLGTVLKKRDNSNRAFIPGIGFSQEFGSRSSIFGGVHRGFAPAGNTEGTDPESSNSFELGFRGSSRAGSLEMVAFLSQYSNLLGSDLAASGGGGSNELFNAGKSRAQGLELTYSILLWPQNKDWTIPFSFNYTYTDAIFLNTFQSDFEAWSEVKAGDHLPYLAAHQAQAGLGLNFRQKADLNIQLRFQSPMRTRPGQGPMSSVNQTDRQIISDLSFNYSLNSDLDLFIQIRNLANSVYIVADNPAGYRPGMPRSISAGLRFDLSK